MSNQSARINMIKQQLRTSNVSDPVVLALFDSIFREEFGPNGYKHFAYSDMQIPLSHTQRMLTPLEEAQLLQALALKGHETVLEVGTGSGFLTALLSRLCKKVISIEYFSELTAQARRTLDRFQYTNIELLTADASMGWFDSAPYDVIIYSGALPSLSETHRLQLLPGGKLFAIIGHAPVMQGQLHHLSHNGQWNYDVIFETSIPLLIDKSKTKEFVF